MSTAASSDTPGARASRSRGELVFDVVLILAIGGYLYVAQGYPPIGREIPTVVGVVALLAAVVQLIGWFVPGMWTFSHGDPDDDDLAHSARRAATEAVGGRTAPAGDSTAAGGVEAAPAAVRRPTDVPVAMAWAGGFLGAILLVGYVVAVPLFFLVYFGVRRSWVLAIASAVVMGVVARLLFETLLGIPLPGGLLY